MALTPATTDKFTKVGSPGSATTMSAPGYTSGASTSMTVGSTTNWPTDTKVIFAVDRAQVVNGVEERIAGTYNEFEGIVTGANTIANVNKRLGNDQNYPAGSLTRVYIPVAATRENDMVEGLNVDHNGKGNHKSLTDDNGNEWFERGSVASAVNQVKATNAATGGAPKLEASGDDANVGLDILPKGTGIVKVDGAAPRQFFALFNFIESGCVWSGLGYGSNLNAAMTEGVVWIAGKRLTVAAVATRAFTASRDTYVDLQDNGDGTAKIVYTEVTNNAASPAIPNSLADATNIRNAIIVSGANIANVGSINQGQEDKVLPIASATPYAVTDSLGNLIYPADPNRKTLGFRQRLAVVTGLTGTGAGAVAVPGLSTPIIISRRTKVKVVIDAQSMYMSAAGTLVLAICLNNASNALKLSSLNTASGSYEVPAHVEYKTTLEAGSYTFLPGIRSNTGSQSFSPGFISVESA